MSRARLLAAAFGADGTLNTSDVAGLSTVASSGLFADLLSKPTTISGYGISDAPTKTGTGASGTWGISISGSAATLTTGRTIGMTGDVTWTSASFNGSGNVTGTATLANSGVTAGTYTKVTVDAKGRVTTGASLASADLPTYTGTITSSQVTTALGYTPLSNATSYLPLAGGTMTGAITFAGGQTWPTFNQNTTGSAATLTTGRTIGMTGDVTWTSSSFNGSANVTGTATLANSGVTAGTYTKITVDAKGRATSGTTLSAADIPALTMANIPGAAYKQSVRCATTANITLSGTQTIDGIAVVAGDRVLVKNQTTASQNGIYVVSASTWSRATDADAADEIGAAIVNVDSGTANGGELWTTTFKTSDTLGTTAMNWYEVLYNTGTWSISISGSAATLTTGRTIGMTGDVTYTSGSFNGSANVTGTATLANSGVTAGSYGSSSAVPVITVDAKGRVTAVSTSSISGSLTFTGDVTGSGSTGASTALTLSNSGVTAGTYTKVTVDAKGRVTTGASLASGDLPTYTGTITSSQVTTALGYTPLSLAGGTLTGTLTAPQFTVSGSSDYLTSTTGLRSWTYQKDISVSSQTTEPRGVSISSDGTKMYVVSNTGSVADGIAQYTLSTPWDIASATYLQSFSLASQGTSPLDLYFKPDGTSFYTIDSGADKVFRYNMTTAWNISTATFASEFSVAGQETDPNALYFSNDGTKMYVIGTTGDDVNQYNLGTAWDITTAVYSTVFVVSAYAGSPQGLAFNSTGTKMWVLGQSFGRIIEYNLGTAWSISSAVFNSYISILLTGDYAVTGASGFFVDESQNKVWMCDYTTDRIFQLTTNVNATQFVGSKFYFIPDTHFLSDLLVYRRLRVESDAYIAGSVFPAAVYANTVNATSSSTGSSLMTGQSTGSVSFYTGQTSGTLTVGGTSGTGTITIGRATTAQAVRIADGANTSGVTKTVAIGANGVSGSTTNVTIGSAVAGANNSITLYAVPSLPSQTANTVFAAPSGSAGAPTFRALVAADIPTLNQNTTGSAATLTTGRTIGMTGDVTWTSGSFNGSANVTGTATLANSGVSAGTYTSATITVDAKGRVTSAASGTGGGTPDFVLQSFGLV